MARPTDDQINEQIGLAVDNNGKWPGMTYEDGVRTALQWALGDSDDAPMSD